MKTDRRLIGYVFLCLTVMVAILLGSATAVAQGGYPQPTDSLINDYAGLLTSDDVTRVRNLFTDLKRDAGVEAVVVTINSIRDYDTGDETIESFATNLFNTWDIGDWERNDGVLILVAVKDREVRIEVGAGYGDTQNANMQEVINEHILPHFKEENYSRGIYLGARAVVGKLTGTWPEDLSQGASSTAEPSSQGEEASSPPSTSSPFANPLNYYGVFLLIVTVAWFFHDRWATRSRRKEFGKVVAENCGPLIVGRPTRLGRKKYNKVRTRSAKGAIAGAVLGVVLSTLAWLGADSDTAVRVSNCLLSTCIGMGTFVGFFSGALGGGGYGGYGGGSSGGGSFGGGSSSGGGASGKW